MHHLNGCNGKLGVGLLGAIKAIHVFFNGLDAAGGACLASALEKNTTLQTLDLGENSVGAAGTASLARIASALERNSFTA